MLGNTIVKRKIFIKLIYIKKKVYFLHGVIGSNKSETTLYISSYENFTNQLNQIKVIITLKLSKSVPADAVIPIVMICLKKV